MTKMCDDKQLARLVEERIRGVRDGDETNVILHSRSDSDFVN